MNNDLEQFSEERLIEIAGGGVKSTAKFDEQMALARIALAAKQAKPVAQVYQPANVGICAALGPAIRMINVGLPVGTLLYTTPQPAHTVQDGWIKCSDRLPDDDSFVLVTNGKHTGMGAYLRDDHLEDDERWQDEHFEFINKQSKYPVTHWMSLPPNPEK